MYQIRLAEPVNKEILGEYLAKASRVAKMRGLKAYIPLLDPFYLRRTPKVSDVWYLTRCGTRYIDILCGVLAGEGFIIVATEFNAPRKKKRKAHLPDSWEVDGGLTTPATATPLEEPGDALDGAGDELS